MTKKEAEEMDYRNDLEQLKGKIHESGLSYKMTSDFLIALADKLSINPHLNPQIFFEKVAFIISEYKDNQAAGKVLRELAKGIL